MDLAHRIAWTLDLLTGPSYHRRQEFSTFELIATTVIFFSGALLIFVLKRFFGWFPKQPPPAPLDPSEFTKEELDEPRHPKYYDTNDE